MTTVENEIQLLGQVIDRPTCHHSTDKYADAGAGKPSIRQKRLFQHYPPIAAVRPSLRLCNSGTFLTRHSADHRINPRNIELLQPKHSIGNGEVDSSILSGSTRTSNENKYFWRIIPKRPFRFLLGGASGGAATRLLVETCNRGEQPIQPFTNSVIN